MDAVLYSDHNERCEELKRKLSDNGIPFTECSDSGTINSLGINIVPVLSVDRELMGFSEAMKFIDIYVSDVYSDLDKLTQGKDKR